MARKTKAQIEQERIALEQKRAEAQRKREEKEREKAEKQARKREEGRSKKPGMAAATAFPARVEIPSAYPGESIFVHQKIYDIFMKNRGISITSYRVEGGMGGKLILEYRTLAGGQGSVELIDLGPMPV